MEEKLDLTRVRKKLAEAHYFLGKMTKQENREVCDTERFDYCLSAFLNAAMSVRNGFQYRQNRRRNQAIKAWRAQWENNLSPDEKSLYEFMRKDRVAEVHHSGSTRTVGEEGVVLPAGKYRTRDGIFIRHQLPTVSPNLVYRPSYSFTIDGADCKATEVCREYLALLRHMVAQFEADYQ